MTIEAATEFRAMVNETPALQSAVHDLIDENGMLDLAAAVKLGQQNGYTFTDADIETLIANDNDELSEFELELVSAGAPVSCNDQGA